jgi:hypothetical protein
MQTAAIAISVAFPFLLYCCARIPGFGSAGRRFRIGSATVAAIFVIACFALPGPRYFDDVLSGILFLATAILLFYVFWSLLAWSFTLTLLTALAGARQPLTQEQWISIYMQGGDLSTFARNRLRLLLGSGMVASAGGEIVATPAGVATIRLVRLIRLATGLG